MAFERSAIKVCHLTSAHFQNDVRIFVKECSSIAASGYTVFLIATGADEKRENGVIFLNACGRESNRFRRMTSAVLKVYRKAKSVNADVYHIHDPELLPVALLFRWDGKKVIYDVHEDLPATILEKYWINKFLRRALSWFVRLFENFAAKQMSWVVTATPFINDRFKKVNVRSVNVNNFPLDMEILKKSDWDLKKNEICYVGGIAEERGIIHLMKALERATNVYLNLAGSFETEKLKQRVMRMNSWNKVNYFGVVDRNKILEIFSRSKAGIVTFLPHPNHINAQPNKLFEYLSAGIPVVASWFPLWKQIVEKNNCGICVNPESADDIADAIIHLTENKNDALLKGQNGRKAIVENYVWSNEEKKLIEVYDSLFQEKIA